LPFEAAQLQARDGAIASRACGAQRRRILGVALIGVLLSAVILLFGGGCHAPQVEKPLTASLPEDPVDAQLEFWHGLEDRPITCNDEAFHGILLLLDGKDDSLDYAMRANRLKSRHLLAVNFDRPGTEAVQRGTVATALVRGLKIPGGVMMSITGAAPRYATRELVYRGMFPPSSPEQTFSGAEFVGIMGKAEDYQHGQIGGATAEDFNAR